MIDTLIDKQDTSEIVREQIAAILVTEIANQKALATGAGKDPALWDLEVYTERSNAWEKFLNQDADEVPIVNVWYDNSNFDGGSSNISERQKSTTIYNIDIVARGVSKADGAGHKPGDKEAALNAQRATRLVRNILMAAEYTYLGLRGTVWQRWPQSITSFQPQIGDTPVQNVAGTRIAMRVGFSEFSPQATADILEIISGTVQRTSDGKIVLEAEYDYTA
jgi:hypothetical protein